MSSGTVVLLVGSLADHEMALVCLRLLQRGVDTLLIDTHGFSQELGIEAAISGGAVTGSLTYGTRRISLESIRSMYLRGAQPADGLDRLLADPNAASAPACDPGSWICALADTLPGPVVNRPAADRSNFSKPFQQSLITRLGFRTPRTLVTTCPDDARRFVEESDRPVIYKSVSAQRSIVHLVSEADRNRFDLLASCPCQFQEYVSGVEIRVHTIGERVFATEIMSPAIDYRYARAEALPCTMRAVELSADLQERCVSLARALGLTFCGIDLRKGDDGEYYCFEANPSPGFAFFQSQAGQPIGDALVDYLCRTTA